MSHPVLNPGDVSTLKYIITHVFCPLQLPDRDDYSKHNDHALAKTITAAARLYSDRVDEAHTPHWYGMSRMLENLQAILRSKPVDTAHTITELSNMDVGAVLALHIRAQNAGVIFRKQKDVTIFESFELSPQSKDVMTAEGKLICSYPGLAINIPNLVFNNMDFRSELTNFLSHMIDDDLDIVAIPSKKEQHPVFKDSVHPRYITELLSGILRSVGRPVGVTPIIKRIGDDVVCNDDSMLPWRRSALWLLIRVALQTTLDRSPLGRNTYKEFLLYFMCFLAEEKACEALPSDLLQFMSAKLSRRLRKLGSSAPDWLSHTVLQTCTSLRSKIESRWKHVQVAQSVSPPWTPSRLNLTRDTQLSLSGSRDYLCNALANHNITPSDISFDPGHHPRATLDDLLSLDGDVFKKAYLVEPFVALYDVERAVEEGIDLWVDRVTNHDEACVKLDILTASYSSSASETYAKNPELLSVMLLTAIELWVAIDKIVVKEIPILADYSPEVPVSFLESILLCSKVKLHRLRLIYEYLTRRHSQSRKEWTVFSSETTADGFAVRFFKKSSHLQRLKTRIEQVARLQVRKKVAELREMNARHVELEKEATKTNQARTNKTKLSIQVHEWPLPSDKHNARAVVFELECPVSFDMWRSATLRVVVDLRSASITRRDSPAHNLNNNLPYLTPYLVKHPRSRISLRFKSNAVNTRFSVQVPATQKEVCIENLQSLTLYDMRTGSIVFGEKDNIRISKEYFTYKLQRGPYQKLQAYVDATSHTSNEVIANQADCDKELPISEYMAFGHLRSGGLLQWLNILRELRSRSLTFRRHDVHMLIAQAVSQAGPLANTVWTWHEEIRQPTFCYALLRELQSLVQDVEANWKEGVTMDTISFLLRRLITSSSHHAVSQEALSLLRYVRGKVFSWVQELLVELIRSLGDEGTRGVLRDTAAICRSTFDVDRSVIPELLLSAEDVDILLSCAIIIHDHTPSDISHLFPYSRLLLDRDRRLSLFLESVFHDMIPSDLRDQGISLAVSRMWPSYHWNSKWIPLDAPNSRWFSCTTVPSADEQPQVVHLNILDGSLMVNRKPFGTWLPNKYVKHPLYGLIFGNKMLGVAQSDLPGMDYSTRNLICDHKVYFSLRNDGEDLVIRAKRQQTIPGDSGILELIPYKRLEGDLPAVLIEGHVHWLNLSTSVMEIRPLYTLWEDSPENWRIDCTPGHCRMQRGQEYLVDIRSQTWDMISSLLEPLSTPQDLIISASPIDPSHPLSKLRLSVLLPRYDLSFFVDKDGDLQCHNIRGMVYDENQSVGTLFGLVHQLVLRPKAKDMNALELIPRCVLIPEGDVSFRMDGHHVCVEITLDRSVLKRATYQTYWVNLGCLTGNASLTSKLYLAYLHALTSGCSVDPLTGRSGTEEAMSVLRSAGCFSSTRLGPRDAELLGLIASLCPPRTWHLEQHVQKVEWNRLPASSQNYEFHLVANAIKSRYERCQPFHESQSGLTFQKFPLSDDHLLTRSARRAVHFLPFRLSGHPSGAYFDSKYFGRDLAGNPSGEYRAYSAAACTCRRTATSAMDICTMVASWKESLCGVSSGTAVSLQYDRSWLAPDLPAVWLKTYDLLRESNDKKWFQLLFSLPAMAYASSNLSDLVSVFVAFASHGQFRFEDPPRYDSFPIGAGYYPSLHALRNCVVNHAYPLERGPEYLLPAKDHENADGLRARQREMYSNRIHSDAGVSAQNVLNAWICETPPPCSLDPTLYDVAAIEFEVRDHISCRFRNLQLKEHLTRVQIIMITIHSASSSTLDPLPSSSCTPWLLTVDKLFTRPAPPIRRPEELSRYVVDVGNTTSRNDSGALQHLTAKVGANATNSFQYEYVSALRTSVKSLGNQASLANHDTAQLPTTEELMEHYTRCRDSYMGALDHLQQQLSPRSESEQAVEQSGQWPRITPQALFRSLASNSQVTLPDDWKKCLITFTLLALELQRARRLVLLHYDNLHEEFCRELQNEGCVGWDAEAHSDWLLIQLQGNFLIRRVQAEIAQEMISPRSGDNTAMQLNMGEGKTSVIVPAVVAALASGNQLVRVIVPKPLTAQTLRILADRLGGLTDRRIYYVPFSRSINVDDQKVTSLRQIMLECMQERGVLVVQADHVLSLKLAGVEKQLAHVEDSPVAHLLLELQKWLHSHSRDILDENDDILDVRSQLVFTIGHQQHVEGSPERWTTTQQVLSLVNKHASSLHELFPLGVEYESGTPGTFPHLRILQAAAGEKLVSWIVEDVINGLLQNVSFERLYIPPRLMEAIQTFISCEEVPSAQVKLVKEYFGKTSLWGSLLLLRGILANGILLFAFTERRWRVDYGLAPTRTMVAVPYRAKDIPSQRAEFGHPDIAIMLTCLSYYYDGLDEEQLRRSFGLLKQHDASSDYNIWVRACPTVPESLRTLSGVNVESVEQWNTFLYPLFSRNRATVDFYLSNIVFPREAKEFPSKLSSSGWDLAERKVCLVTGFSGTNDGKHLLPLHITQHDPDHQRGTNARVLSYLLRPENKHYMCTAHDDGKRRTTREFLDILTAQKPEIRVLLDVGAQMLDLQNDELARAWLDISPNASAAIYFNEVDELMVRTRDGTTQLVLSSPYAEQLDRCLVYLDDAHTRGTDIKFPVGFRAAVTLGPKVTKDRLVQGCMRMRKLGHGHSIMFFAPLEVDQRIRSVSGKIQGALDSIDTTDILHWAIRETWENIQRWAPHWAQQGMDHTSRHSAWTGFCRGQITSKELSVKWLQPEAKKLEDLYEPRHSSGSRFVAVPAICQRCTNLGVLSHWSVGMDEEQERELVYEVKREQQVERRVPPKVRPSPHSLDHNVINFVKTGVIPTLIEFPRMQTRVFTPVFETLHTTSAATDEAYIWSRSVLATTDFQQTIGESKKNVEDYLRPVQWVVSARGDFRDVLVILSPYEVNCLLPDIRLSNKVRLHLYTPRLAKSTIPRNDSDDDFALHSIPAVPDGWTCPSYLTDQLCLFSGQLYLKDYATYIRLCRFFCVYARDLQGEDAIIVEPDGFILPKNRNPLKRSRARTEIAHTFANSPLVALRALMHLRNQGIDFSSTHMGKLLRGQLLSEDDF